MLTLVSVRWEVRLSRWGLYEQRSYVTDTLGNEMGELKAIPKMTLASFYDLFYQGSEEQKSQMQKARITCALAEG